MNAQFDSFDWDWAYTNVVQDYEEQGKLLFSFMDTLTWWLQPQIKNELKKPSTHKWPQASQYVKELREQGASEAYIRKEMAAIERNRANQEAGFHQGDNLEVIKGPHA